MKKYMLPSWMAITSDDVALQANGTRPQISYQKGQQSKYDEIKITSALAVT